MAKRKEEFNDKVYILLLSSILILIESLKEYILNIHYINIPYSILLLPFTYYLVHYIYKKSNYKKSMVAILISTLVVFLFEYLMAFSLHESFSILTIGGELCAYFISQIIGIHIYHFMKNNTKLSFLLVYLDYLLSLIIFYLIQILFQLDSWNLDTFKTQYFPILLVSIFICISFSFIERK